MSDTPRTDAACGWPWGHHGRIECGDLKWSPDGPFVHSEVARQLERENAALRAALKPLLRHRPDGDVGWRGNAKAKCGWILVSDILRVESALGKEAQP